LIKQPNLVHSAKKLEVEFRYLAITAKFTFVKTVIGATKTSANMM